MRMLIRSAQCVLERETVRVSAFRGSRVAAKPATKVVTTPRMEFEISDGMNFEINPTIIALALVGWIGPSSLPAGIPLTNGTGLSQAFFASMNENLAAWPKGPGADDPFWTLCFLWHIGLMSCMLFGTIGVNLKKYNAE